MAFTPFPEAEPAELPDTPAPARRPPRIVQLGLVDRMKRQPGVWHVIGTLDNVMEYPPSRDMRRWFAGHDPEWTIEMRSRSNDDEPRTKTVYARMRIVGNCSECKGLGRHYRKNNQTYDCVPCSGTGTMEGQT